MHREYNLSSNPILEKQFVKELLRDHRKRLGEVKSPMKKFFDEMGSDPAMATYRTNNKSVASAKRDVKQNAAIVHENNDYQLDIRGHYGSTSRKIRINAKKEL